jgi:hypothetical protein
MQIPQDIFQAIIALISAIIGWIARGKRNGHDTKPPADKPKVP